MRRGLRRSRNQTEEPRLPSIEETHVNAPAYLGVAGQRRAPTSRGRPQGPEGPALRKGPEEEKGWGPAPHGAQEADGVCPCVRVCACVCVCPSTCLPPPTCSSGPVDLEGWGRAHVLTQGWGVSCTDFCWGGGLFYKLEILSDTKSTHDINLASAQGSGRCGIFLVRVPAPQFDSHDGQAWGAGL